MIVHSKGCILLSGMQPCFYGLSLPRTAMTGKPEKIISIILQNHQNDFFFLSE